MHFGEGFGEVTGFSQGPFSTLLFIDRLDALFTRARSPLLHFSPKNRLESTRSTDLPDELLNKCFFSLFSSCLAVP